MRGTQDENGAEGVSAVVGERRPADSTLESWGPAGVQGGGKG